MDIEFQCNWRRFLVGVVRNTHPDQLNIFIGPLSWIITFFDDEE